MTSNARKWKIAAPKILGILFFTYIFTGYLYLSKNKDVKELIKKYSIMERVKGPLNPDNKEIIDLIQAQFLKPPSNLKYNLSSRSMYKLHYAKSLTFKFIHSKLKALFEDEPPGFYVEAGALDGELLSNTLWLEKDKGWTGLLIEPDAVNFNALAFKNRKAWMSKSCLATTPYPKMSTFVTYSLLKEQTKFDSSFDWFSRSLTRELDQGLKIPPPQKHHDVYSTVQCFPLESFVYALNKSAVDFLSLDIQGGELEVLQQFPFYKIPVRVIAVEYVINGTRGLQSEKLKSFMNNVGYTLVGVSIEPDYFYIKNGDPLLTKIKDFVLEKPV